MRALSLSMLVLGACGRAGFDPLVADAKHATDDGGPDGDDGDDGGITGDGGLTTCVAGAPKPIAALAGNAHSPSMIWNGSEYAVVWYDRRVDPYNIYLARLDASGTKLGNESNISQSMNDHTWFPSLAWSGSEYAITWGVEAGSNDIAFRRASSAGAPQGTIATVGGGGGEAWWPVIVWTGASYFIAWADDTISNYELVISVRSAAGGEVRAETRPTPTDTNTWGPTATFTGSEVVVGYTEGGTEIWVQRFAPDGTIIGARTLVATGTDVERPTLAWSGSELGIAWIEAPALTDVVRFARLDSSGVVQGAATSLSSRPSRHPQVAWVGDGYAVAWIEDVGAADWRVMLATLDPSGALRTEPTPIATANSSGWPALAWSGTSLAIAYSTNTVDTDLYAVTATCP